MAAQVDEIARGENVSGRAWGILAVTYLASVCAPICQFKVPAAADWIFMTFGPAGLDGTTFGLLMSALSVIGVILAFPAAWLAKGMGLKNTILLSVACLGVGSALFGLVNTIPLLMCARALEGIGLGLIGVAAPSCVTIWFPERKRGLALGIWATWVPVGQVVAFNTVPLLAIAGGLPLPMFCVAGLCAVAFILFALVFKMPEGAMGDMGLGVEGGLLESFRLLNNYRIWILGLIFFLFAVTTIGGFSTYYNTHLSVNLGFDAVTAGNLVSVTMVLSTVAAPLTGLISDRMPLGRKYVVGVVMFALLLVTAPLMFYSGAHALAAMWVVIVLQGIGGGMAGGTMRPMAPMLMQNTAMGATMAMGMLQFFQNLGTAVGSPLLGYLYEHVGWWEAGLIIMVPGFAIALILCFFVLPRGKDATLYDKRGEEAWPQGF